MTKILSLQEGRNKAVSPDSFEAKELIVPASRNHVALSTIRNITQDVAELQKVFYLTDFARAGNWYYDDSDNNSPDNTGTCVVTSWGGRIKRDLSTELYILPYWFKTNNNTVFQSIQAAIDVAKSVGKPVLIDDEYVYGDTEIYIPQGVRVIGKGVDTTTFYYGGTGTCLKVDRSQEDNIDLFKQSGVENTTIEAVGSATTSSSAEGLRLGNLYGSVFRNVFVKFFYQGKGIHFVNDKIWTEGVVLDNVNLRYCKKGISYTVEGQSLSQGYFSFCNTRAYHVNIVTTNGQTGVYVGVNSHIYASTLIVKGNFEGNTSTEIGVNQIGLHVDGGKIEDSHLDVYFEGGGMDNTCSTLKVTNHGLVHYYGQIKTMYANNRGIIVDSTSLVKRTENSNYFTGNLSGKSVSQKRRKIYTLKAQDDNSNFEKLLICVSGGSWFATGSSLTRYYIANRGGLKFYKDSFGGASSGFNIRAFKKKTDNTVDIVLENTIDFPAFDVSIELLEYAQKTKLLMSSQDTGEYNIDLDNYDEVTPSPENVIRLYENIDQVSVTNEMAIYKKGDELMMKSSNIESQLRKVFRRNINAQDGILEVARGGVLDGVFELRYVGANRRHHVMFSVTSMQYAGVYTISILNELIYNSTPIFTNIRVMQKPDSSEVGIVCDIVNSNGQEIEIIGQTKYNFYPAFGTQLVSSIPKINKNIPNVYSGIIILNSGVGTASVKWVGDTWAGVASLKNLAGSILDSKLYKVTCSTDTVSVEAIKSDGSINTLDNSSVNFIVTNNKSQ